MGVTTRMRTVDDIADVGGGSGPLTSRAGTMAEWATLDGAPARTFDDYATGGASPEPIPAPVADFTWTPTNPTEADEVLLDASISTPQAHIDAWEWTQTFPGDGASTVGPVLNLGAMSAGGYVYSLRVRVSDGRWSAPRARGFNVAEAE